MTLTPDEMKTMIAAFSKLLSFPLLNAANLEMLGRSFPDRVTEKSGILAMIEREKMVERKQNILFLTFGLGITAWVAGATALLNQDPIAAIVAGTVLMTLLPVAIYTAIRFLNPGDWPTTLRWKIRGDMAEAIRTSVGAADSPEANLLKSIADNLDNPERKTRTALSDDRTNLLAIAKKMLESAPSVQNPGSVPAARV